MPVAKQLDVAFSEVWGCVELLVSLVSAASR
jgi:hypothetical protein